MDHLVAVIFLLFGQSACGTYRQSTKPDLKDLMKEYDEIEGCDYFAEEAHFRNMLCTRDIRIYAFSLKCPCDSLCQQFQDCCLDKAYAYDFKRPQGQIIKQKCHRLPKPDVKPLGIWMVTTCPNNWQQGRVEHYCESDIDLSLLEDNFSILLYTTPVHSNATGLFYKNVYCAICNDDGDHLSDMNLSLDTEMNGRPTSELTTANELAYNHSIGAFAVPGEKYETVFYPAFNERDPNLRPRYCSLRNEDDSFVSSCPDPDHPLARYCSGYDAPLIYFNHTKYLSNSMQFKNYHCFQCSGIKLLRREQLVCKSPKLRSWTFEPWANVRVLLNMTHLPYSRVEDPSECTDYSEHYVPAFRRCFIVIGGVVEKRVFFPGTYERRQRGRQDSDDHLHCNNSYVYDHNHFRALDSGDVELSGGIVLTPNEYRINKDVNGIILSIATCAENVQTVGSSSNCAGLPSNSSFLYWVYSLLLFLSG